MTDTAELVAWLDKDHPGLKAVLVELRAHEAKVDAIQHIHHTQATTIDNLVDAVRESVVVFEKVLATPSIKRAHRVVSAALPGINAALKGKDPPT